MEFLASMYRRWIVWFNYGGKTVSKYPYYEGAKMIVVVNDGVFTAYLDKFPEIVGHGETEFDASLEMQYAYNGKLMREIRRGKENS